MKTKASGYQIHSESVNGHKVVAIVTGANRPTTNRKTGDMLQIWFLLEDTNPVEAVKTGLDSNTVCQGCPFASGNGCYVNIGQAPLKIWQAWKDGKYPLIEVKDYSKVFGGRKVRFGAYGNPTILPIAKVKLIANTSIGWTGY